MDRIFHAFLASRAGKSVGVLGFWPHRAFDAKFLVPAEERLVVEAFLENGSQVNAGMINRLDDEGLSLIEVNVTDWDTVFSVYSRVMNAPAVAEASETNLTYLGRRVRTGLLARALRGIT